MTSVPDNTPVQAFRDRIRGEVLRPGDQGYEEARTGWNARFDGRPALIARCTDADDVSAAVRFAREHELTLAIRSGGHDYAGNWVSDGGLLIDLSPMNTVRVDPQARTARLHPAARWGAVDRQTQAFGLATTGCTVSTVGVAGYTLGGGTGWLARRHGLALDNLMGAEVVTAVGERVRADEDENPHLFWALRGGGANFGVVTSLEFRLHEAGPEVLSAQVFHPFDNAREVLRFYRTFMQDAPDELTAYAFVLRVPPVEPFPQAFHGKPALALLTGHTSATAEGEAALQPLLDFGEPILKVAQPMAYATLQQSFDAGMARGPRWYTKAHFVRDITDAVIDVFVDYAARLPGQFTATYFEPLGGAIGRVDPSATAFPHRRAAYEVHIFPGWTDPAEDEQMMRWAREFHEALKPYATGGTYVNLLDGDEADPAAAAYGENLNRLRDLKKKWDPDNLFRMNHNIRPSA
jgi:FAD/FMN-containing dehydrogenase